MCPPTFIYDNRQINIGDTMSEVPMPVEELIKRGNNIPVAYLDRKTWNYAPISEEERKWIGYVFDYGLNHLRKILPSVAADIAQQREAVFQWASVAKATFPVRKNYEFPSTTGSLGVAWLFPGGIKYAATPSESEPAYTSYSTNSWDLSLTAGTPVYFFGDGTNFYKASPTTDKHSFILVFKDGIIELGTTPSLYAFQLKSEGKQDYGVYTVQPIKEIPVERATIAYQYPTPMGMLPISYDRGIMFGAMPDRTGTSTIKLLGLVFYEHDLYPNLSNTWIS